MQLMDATDMPKRSASKGSKRPGWNFPHVQKFTKFRVKNRYYLARQAN
jgi:hypothetical protein